MKFTVVRAQTIKSPDLARAGKEDMWVIYSREDGSIDSVTLPTETFSDRTLAAAVRIHEDALGALRGKTLEA